MKRLLLVGLALAAFGGAASTAQASCHNFSCVNRQISSLRATINQQSRVISVLTNCLGELPVTQYGSSAGTFGYVFDSGGGAALFDTTAMDGTNSGDNVSAWMMFDKCNTVPTAASDIRSARAVKASMFGPIAQSYSFTAFPK